jgi:hypothetical protein
MKLNYQGERDFQLLVRPHPFRNEGPKGYLLRLAEDNYLTVGEIEKLGVFYQLDILQKQGLLPDPLIYPELHITVDRLTALLTKEARVWNHQYARYCPHCLKDEPYWRLGWELAFNDACHEHGIWLIDQCSSCGSRVDWKRESLLRCQCGADLRQESPGECPEAVRALSDILMRKVVSPESTFNTPLEKLDIEETQRLVRYLGTYMSPMAGKNPLKIKQASAMSASWMVTSIASEILSDWPNAFYASFEKIQNETAQEKSRQLGSVFGRAYHYLYRGLIGAAFNPVRDAFETWLSTTWRGGLAKRNKRLTTMMLKRATWIPMNIAGNELGVSYQRVKHLINSGVIEGEVHLSKAGRQFFMVRRDQLELAKDSLEDSIDMTMAGEMLGLNKKRVRLILTQLFPDARKRSLSDASPWNLSSTEVERLLEIGNGIEKVSIPDEGCISLDHILRYWAWPNEDLVRFIIAVRSGEISPLHLLDGAKGISAWIFMEREVKAWRAKTIQGYGTWLTVDQVAKFLGINQQSTYELFRKQLIRGDTLHNQPRGGIRVKRTEVEHFKETYAFCTEIAQQLGVSPNKAIALLSKHYIEPVSGPGIDGARKITYLRNDQLKSFLERFLEGTNKILD